MYEAMARRYRPQTFDEVIGQEHVAQTLKNSIVSGRVAHAYLFCGPHGCGKTSMARIFACALVCESGPTATPCGKCEICRDVLRGQDIDVQEIDGASNNGVEQVRALREQVGYVPSRARFKIYIIDEVHMLSVAAFNALLKTLEEPPAHVKFFLATTDPHKILGTILSRCQRFDFRLVPALKMSTFLKGLVVQENAEITDNALAAIAAFSGGSMRDGLVLLDQLVSFCSGRVTREDVERVRGVASAESVAGLFEAIASHDIKSALKLVDRVSALGTNVGDFLDQLIAFGRDLMHLVATGSDEGITAYGPARSTLLAMAAEMSLEQTLLILDMFTQARTRVRTKALTNPLIPLEMAIARLAGIETLSPVKDIVERISAYASGAPVPEVRASSVGTYREPVRPDLVAKSSEPPATVASVAEVCAERPEQELVERYIPKNEEVHFTPDAHRNEVPWHEEVLSTGPLNAEVEVGIVTEVEPESVGAEQADEIAEAGENTEPDSAAVGVADFSEEKDVAVRADINLEKLWSRILEVLAQKSRTDAPFLGDVYIERYEPGELYLSVPGGGTFIYEQLEEKHRKERLAASASEILGVSVKVFLVLREAITPEVVASGAGSVDDRHQVEEFVSPAQRMLDAGRERGVRVILDNFEGSIINIEDT